MKKMGICFLSIVLILSLSMGVSAGSGLRNEEGKRPPREAGMIDENGNWTEINILTDDVTDQKPILPEKPAKPLNDLGDSSASGLKNEEVERILRKANAIDENGNWIEENILTDDMTDPLELTNGHRLDEVFLYEYDADTKEKSAVTYGDVAMADYETLSTDQEPIPPVDLWNDSDTYDPKVYDIFERFHLIDREGNFDWEAFAAIPVEDMPEDVCEAQTDASLPDHRVQVSSDQVTSSPYRDTCYVLATFGKELRRGSGALVASNLALTAAHVLEENGKIADDVVVIPAQYGKNQNPYGSVRASGYKISGEYLPDKSSEYDWGGVEFNRNLGLGAFGLRSYTTDLSGSDITITGYPSHLEGESERDPQHYEMFTGSGECCKEEMGQTYVRTDISKGNSGGPMHQGGYYIGVATKTAKDHSYAAGVRLNATMWSYIMQFRN